MSKAKFKLNYDTSPVFSGNRIEFILESLQGGVFYIYN